MLEQEASLRVKTDLENQQGFAELIGGLSTPVIHPMPDLSEGINHSGASTEGLEKYFEGQGDRFYASPALLNHAGEEYMPDQVAFDVKSLLRMGREDSWNLVFMGLLKVKWPNNGSEHSVEVAVKPISSESSRGQRQLHEISMYQHLGKIGISSLEVIGVAMHGEPRGGNAGYVVTRLVPELTTMDTIPWSRLTASEKWDEAKAAIQTLATLHARLIFHGDAEFKNIGIGEADQSIKIVDLEWGASARDVADDVAKIALYMSHDMSFIAKSIDNFVFTTMPENQQPANQLERFEVLLERLYQPYIELIMRSGSPHVGVLLEAYSIVMEKKAKQSLQLENA